MTTGPFDRLPQPVLDKLVGCILGHIPASALLSAFGKRISAAAVNAYFRDMNLEDDANVFLAAPVGSTMVSSIFSNSFIASLVQSITIIHPGARSRDLADGNEERYQPVGASQLQAFLEACPNLESFVWKSGLPPPDGICETLSSKLSRFVHKPAHPTFPRTQARKWDAHSLPLLNSLPLTSLTLHNLSQAGARAFQTLLTSLSDESSSLEALDVNFIWLDDSVCAAIATTLGPKLHSLVVGTAGTKLTDRGLVSLAEGCFSLKDLVLSDVQGRLSRSVWSKPASYSPKLRRLHIVVSDCGTGHSWAGDHLDSLGSLPIGSLTELRVVRKDVHFEDALTRPIRSMSESSRGPPSGWLQGLHTASSLSSLHCDFWTLSICELKEIIGRCQRLEDLRVCLDDSLSKILGISSFSNLSSLRLLAVYITSSKHALSVPANVSDYASAAPLAIPSLVQTELRPLNNNTDPYVPQHREIKKFARKCPSLQQIDWYDLKAQGTWLITRSAKLSNNISVAYHASTRSHIGDPTEFREMDEQLFQSDVPRQGQVWTGEQALLHSIQEEPISTRPRLQEIVIQKKSRKPSISTSSSSASELYMPSTPGKSQPVSPMQTHIRTPSSSSPTEPSRIRVSEEAQHWKPARPREAMASTKASPAETTAISQPPAKAAKRSVKNAPELTHLPVTRARRGRGRGSSSGKAETNLDLTKVSRGRAKTAVGESTRKR